MSSRLNGVVYSFNSFLCPASDRTACRRLNAPAWPSFAIARAAHSLSSLPGARERAARRRDPFRRRSQHSADPSRRRDHQVALVRPQSIASTIEAAAFTRAAESSLMFGPHCRNVRLEPANRMRLSIQNISPSHKIRSSLPGRRRERPILRSVPRRVGERFERTARAG